MCHSLLYLQYLFFTKEGHKNEDFGREVFFDPFLTERGKCSITAPEQRMFNQNVVSDGNPHSSF